MNIYLVEKSNGPCASDKSVVKARSPLEAVRLAYERELKDDEPVPPGYTLSYLGMGGGKPHVILSKSECA